MLASDTLGSLRPLPYAGEPELGVQSGQPTSSSRRYGLDSIALALKSSTPNGVVGVSAETWSTATARSHWRVRVEHPPLTSLGPPLAGEVDEGLVEILGDNVDVCRFTSTAHGNVSEFPATAVGKEVCTIDCCPLHAVDGDRVGVVEVIARQLVADKDAVATVIETDVERLIMDTDHDCPLAGHEPTVPGRGQRDDSVASGVALAARRLQLRATHGTGLDASTARACVESCDIDSAPGQHHRLTTRTDVGLPSLNGYLHRVLAGGAR